jgi:uncharacterized membrane protein YuzA (DUF378 family)
MRNLDVVAAALVIIGALNWGLAGAFHLDLVAALFGMRFGETSAVTTVVYSLVALAGLYQALTWKAIQRRWQGMTPARAVSFSTAGDRRYVATHAHPRASLIGDDFAVQGQ